ncbi:MAG: FAD-binding protein [Candidatus Competibacteraceae bacterium]|nr:FAD-binding protein [Candidatus Competibacteraceae bacterium]
MTEQHYDAIVIGSGAGGSAVAYQLVRNGKTVLMLEKVTACRATAALWTSNRSSRKANSRTRRLGSIIKTGCSYRTSFTTSAAKLNGMERHCYGSDGMNSRLTRRTSTYPGRLITTLSPLLRSSRKPVARQYLRQRTGTASADRQDHQRRSGVAGRTLAAGAETRNPQ